MNIFETIDSHFVLILLNLSIALSTLFSLSMLRPLSTFDSMCAVEMDLCHLDTFAITILNSFFVYLFHFFFIESVGFVNICLVLHELPAAESKAVLTEAYRILKPGGTLAM